MTSLKSLEMIILLALLRTQQRNFQAVLHAMSSGGLSTDLLISHRFLFENADSAYQLLTSSESYLGILFQYNGNGDPQLRSINLTDVEEPSYPSIISKNPAVLSFIGAGNYASRI